MSLTNIEKARQIATEYLKTLEKELGEPLGLVHSETQEKTIGWVFFYNSKDYIETGNFRTSLAGNAPFIVLKQTGGIYVTGTGKPLEDYIAEYESERN